MRPLKTPACRLTMTIHGSHFKDSAAEPYRGARTRSRNSSRFSKTTHVSLEGLKPVNARDRLSRFRLGILIGQTPCACAGFQVLPGGLAQPRSRFKDGILIALPASTADFQSPSDNCGIL